MKENMEFFSQNIQGRDFSEGHRSHKTILHNKNPVNWTGYEKLACNSLSMSIAFKKINRL